MLRIKTLTIFFIIFCAGIATAQFTVSFKGDKLTGCDSLLVHFTDQTSTSISGIVSWSWDFGDGKTDTLQNPNHLYTHSGVYTVKLKVLRIVNGVPQAPVTGTKTNYITTFPKPLASFTTKNSQNNSSYSVSFISNTHLDTAGLSYIWNFGDNSIDSGSYALHTYNAEGSYNVNLKITDNHSCQSDTTKKVTVSNNFMIPNFFSPNGDGINDDFAIETNGSLLYKLEIFDRWGNQIYETTALNIRWDGRNTAGLLMNSGMFYYVLTSSADTTHSKMAGILQLQR